MSLPQFLLNGSPAAPHRLLLAHGAGAGSDSPFLETIATGLAERGIYVGRFEFPYMKTQRKTGRRRPPDRQPTLEAAWRQAVERFDGAGRLFIGGKSLGGRIASLLANELEPAGLVCLGYPFHPAGKPDRLRVAHLAELTRPTLIVQGERDPFGSRDEVSGYRLSATIELHWLPDGDHSFRPRKSSGHTEEQHLASAVERVAEFVRQD